MSEIDIPTVKATAIAPTEFLTLCMPSKGIFIFLINIYFLLGTFISTSNSVNFLFCLIFLIKKFEFRLVP